MRKVTIQQVYADLRDALDLSLLTALPGEEVELPSKDVHRPGMALIWAYSAVSARFAMVWFTSPRMVNLA